MTRLFVSGLPDINGAHALVRAALLLAVFVAGAWCLRETMRAADVSSGARMNAADVSSGARMNAADVSSGARMNAADREARR